MMCSMADRELTESKEVLNDVLFVGGSDAGGDTISDGLDNDFIGIAYAEKTV